MYFVRQAWANSEDPDANAASYQGLHCLPLTQVFRHKRVGSKLDLVQILDEVW